MFLMFSKKKNTLLPLSFFEEKNISFWFENDELQEIQWGVI